MGEKMNNCWCFVDGRGVCKSVWAVCTKCEEQGLDRDDYWINLVPNAINTFDDFIKETNRRGQLIIRCNQGRHDVVIRRHWFARKGMEEPER